MHSRLPERENTPVTWYAPRSKMSKELPEIYLARHGETAWTLSHQHTGRSDIPLTARGELNARSLGDRLRGIEFQRVLTSPLERARRTCELAGFIERTIVDLDLMEWNYGVYDGKTSAEIRRENANWLLFRDGCPGGETVEEVGARADRVIARLRAVTGANCCSVTATFSAFWRRGGSVCRPRKGGYSTWARRRSRSKVTSIRSTSRRFASGMMIATCINDRLVLMAPRALSEHRNEPDCRSFETLRMRSAAIR